MAKTINRVAMPIAEKSNTPVVAYILNPLRGARPQIGYHHL